MNLPFFFLKSLQKMSDRVKGHKDHTQQSIFHHGLIKLIVNTVLQKKSRTWEHFLFWLGIQTQQENQRKKRQMNKHHCLVKRLKREIIDEMVKDNIQEECLVPKFEEFVGEEIRGVLNENQVQISENIVETLEEDIKQEEDKITLEKNLISRSIQEEIVEVPVPDKLKIDTLQSSNEKLMKNWLCKDLEVRLQNSQMLNIKANLL